MSGMMTAKKPTHSRCRLKKALTRVAFPPIVHTPLLYTEPGLAVCSSAGNFYNSLTAFTKNLPAAEALHIKSPEHKKF